MIGLLTDVGRDWLSEFADSSISGESVASQVDEVWAVCLLS